MTRMHQLIPGGDNLSNEVTELKITKIIRRSERVEIREYMPTFPITYIFRSQVTKDIAWLIDYSHYSHELIFRLI